MLSSASHNKCPPPVGTILNLKDDLKGLSTDSSGYVSHNRISHLFPFHCLPYVQPNLPIPG